MIVSQTCATTQQVEEELCLVQEELCLVPDLQRNHPFASASSAAFSTMPVPFPAFGVTITLAPSIRMSFLRSTLNGSAIVMTQG